ncbi:hypothetical protein MNV49_000666 [Pseudohyphozyma bogoriensis]|nr:hypothetical protein MNV49_000666 [Pseudohyphozyma bogoriensis]
MSLLHDLSDSSDSDANDEDQAASKDELIKRLKNDRGKLKMVSESRAEKEKRGRIFKRQADAEKIEFDSQPREDSQATSHGQEEEEDELESSQNTDVAPLQNKGKGRAPRSASASVPLVDSQRGNRSSQEKNDFDEDSEGDEEREEERRTQARQKMQAQGRKGGVEKGSSRSMGKKRRASTSSEEESTEAEEETPPPVKKKEHRRRSPSTSSSSDSSPPPPPKKPQGKNRHRLNRPGAGERIAWSSEEVAILEEEMKEFGTSGTNTWANIITRHGPHGTKTKTLQFRHNVSVKDKARNIKENLIKSGRKVPWYLDGVTEGNSKPHRFKGFRSASRLGSTVRYRYERTLVMSAFESFDGFLDYANQPASNTSQQPPPPAAPPDFDPLYAGPLHPHYASYELPSNPYAPSSPHGGWTNQGDIADHHSPTFNPLDHTRLSPSNFDPNNFSSGFVPPKFVAGGMGGEFADGPAVVEPLTMSSPAMDLDFGTSGDFGQKQGAMPPPPLNAGYSTSHSHSRRTSLNMSMLPHESPVYDYYGSSVVAINSPLSMPPPPPLMARRPSLPASPQSPFDPAALGLPLPPPPSSNKNFEGLYSSSGMDIMSILSKVVTRPNPEIQIGPVDMACAFLVTDARKFDNPIVYASETFSVMTGYSNAEILGRNCRFLQSPDGIVESGSKRKYTDGNAVAHLKKRIDARQESQASLINYHKSGRPFINLVTVIPITWNSGDEIAFFVGFQVDLVDQPSSILDKMKNGSYIVNYSLTANIPRNPLQVPTSPAVMDFPEDMWAHSEEKKSRAAASAIEHVVAHTPADIINRMAQPKHGVLPAEEWSKQMNKLLLDNCDDLVHVVSLKGTILYVSPSVAKLLEYEPKELVGQTLASICHPSDIVAVLRELKESGTAGHGTVNLLCRIRRKFSGYMWLESSGKLYVEQGKGRKCVILTGRPQKVYRLSWEELERAGGLGESEFWSKWSLDGMILYTTPTIETILGYKIDELRGTNVSLIDEGDQLLTSIRAIATSPAPVASTLSHRLKNKAGGYVDVVTDFFPSPSHVNADDHSTTPNQLVRNELYTIIARTSLSIVSGSKRQHPPSHAELHRSNSSSSDVTSSLSSQGGVSAVSVPAFRNKSSDEEGETSSSGSKSTSRTGSGGSSSTSFSAIPSTFKTLSSSSSDNIFDELETTRGTSWQYELHQLRLINRKLREEKDTQRSAGMRQLWTDWLARMA